MKANSGKTVSKWINDALIAEAKILLRDMDMSIQRISEELDFSNPSSFCKFFKRQLGQTPLEYRNSLF